MTITETSARDHLQAVIACLEAEDLPVGDGITPAGGPPHFVVHWLYPSRFDGPINDADADVSFTFQVTCVGMSQSECIWLADRATHRLQIGPLTVPGRQGMRNATGIAPVAGGTQPRRDDVGATVLFYCTPRFTLTTTPA